MKVYDLTNLFAYIGVVASILLGYLLFLWMVNALAKAFLRIAERVSRFFKK